MNTDNLLGTAVLCYLFGGMLYIYIEEQIKKRKRKRKRHGGDKSA